MSESIRILLVDDHAVVREGLRHLLTTDTAFRVVGEAGDGDAAVGLAASQRPDVILLDIRMPGGSGLEVIGRLRAAVPDARVLILTMHDHDAYVVEAVRAGAHGYILKDSEPAALRAAVREVHATGEAFGPGVSEALRRGLAAERDQADRRAALERLTAREREVMGYVAGGLTNRDIGTQLGISPRTVETHRENLMKKLAIHSVAELTRVALEHGITSD